MNDIELTRTRELEAKVIILETEVAGLRQEVSRLQQLVYPRMLTEADVKKYREIWYDSLKV